MTFFLNSPKLLVKYIVYKKLDHYTLNYISLTQTLNRQVHYINKIFPTYAYYFAAIKLSTDIAFANDSK